MKKGLRRMYLAFLSPVVIAFLIAYLYPVLRTVQMSFFEVSDISAARDTWEFVGLYNYVDLFSRQLFRVSFKNMMLIFQMCIRDRAAAGRRTGPPGSGRRSNGRLVRRQRAAPVSYTHLDVYKRQG